MRPAALAAAAVAGSVSAEVVPPADADAVRSVQQSLAAACPVVVAERDAVVVADQVEHQRDDPSAHWEAWQSNWPVCSWADVPAEAAEAVATAAPAVRLNEAAVAVHGAPAWATAAARAH